MPVFLVCCMCTGFSLSQFSKFMYALMCPQIFAVPRDINVLSEYDNDPRVVDNLLDGVNQTRDDVHTWLAPFTAGQDHTVTIIFPQLTTISVVRLWVCCAFTSFLSRILTSSSCIQWAWR